MNYIRSQNGVAFVLGFSIFLNHIVTSSSSGSFKCSPNIPKQCQCQSGGQISLACWQNTGNISVKAETKFMDVAGIVNRIIINCTNEIHSDNALSDLFTNLITDMATNGRPLALQLHSCSTLNSALFGILVNNPDNLKYLAIGQNVLLTTLSDDIFTNMKSKLWRLDLSDNKLKNLSEQTFVNQFKLWKLNLNRNALLTLPENIFNNLPNLTWLYIKQNKLISLPESIFKHQKKLRFLNASENFLETLPDGLFRHTINLSVLDLSGNRLIGLPANIFQHIQLKVLRLEGNHLMALPEFFFINQPWLSKSNQSRLFESHRTGNNSGFQWLQIQNL